MIGLDFVITFLTFDADEIQFVDQPLILEHCNRSLHGGAIDRRILFPGHREQRVRVQVARGLLNNANNQPPLLGSA
jgi:hypothetical protein